MAGGSTFDVRSVSASRGRLVVEARRVLGAGESAYNFPARLAERLEGPCGLPRADELMFESWAAASGFKPGSASVLGGEYWCEDPAFGAPCECVKVLLRGKTV